MKAKQLPVFGLAISVFILTAVVPASAGAEDEQCQLPRHGLDVSDLPEGSSVEDCDAVGRVITDGTLAVKIPEPGKGVSISVLAPGEGSAEFGVSVDDDGTVEYRSTSADVDPADERGSRISASTPAEKDRCVDRGFNFMGLKRYTPLKWALSFGPTPADLPRGKFWEITTRAMRAITDTVNDCGFPDIVDATAEYQGSVENTANLTVGSDGKTACGDPDDVSVVDAARIPGESIALAVTCSWYFTHEGMDALDESDIRVDISRYQFFADPAHCDGRYDVQGVLTHEVGHAFGLDHVSEEDHPNLTMSEHIGKCEISARTVGRGDVAALRALY